MNKQKDLWNKAHLEGDMGIHPTSPSDFAKSILPLIKHESKILELGCGVGNDSIAFANAGHEVIATDFSEVAIDKNKERMKNIKNLNFEILDISKPLSFENSTFDVVYAGLSLHYFNDKVTRRIYKEINRILKPNGVLCFMCKSTNDPLYGKGEKIENEMYEFQGHVRHFSSKKYALECLAGKFAIKLIEEKTGILHNRESSFIEVVAMKL